MRASWFERTVIGHPKLRPAYRPGLKALRGDSKKVRCEDPLLLQGSVNVDQALAVDHPDDPRWDYVIGFGNHAIWVEVHPFTNDRNLREVIAKKRWMEHWLDRELPALHGEWVWISTAVARHSRQRKGLAEQGIQLSPRVLHLRAARKR